VIIVGLLVAGGVGSVLRYLVDRTVQSRVGSDVPLGILVVNLSGALALGFLVGVGLHHGISATWLTVLGTGLIGAYTTFSTFAFDSVRLAEADQWGMAAANMAVSVALGIGAAAAGLALASLT
jgi:CrcB protein